MTRKFYVSLVQRLVFHGASNALLADIETLLKETNESFNSEKYWDYVRVCRKYKEDL